MRIAKIDNTKGLLITLVVFGHLLENFFGWNDLSARPVLNWIYSFHMPLFIILCGLTFNNKDLLNKVFFVLSVFLIFQFLYAIPGSIKDGKYIYNLLTPYWILWFLVSLASWMVLYRIFGSRKYSIFISIIISVIGGVVHLDGSYFSYMRTLTFLPFFFIGVRLRGVEFPKLIEINILSAIAFLTLSAVFVYGLLSLNISNRFLFGSYGYQGIGYDFISGATTKIITLGISLAISLLLYASMPDKETFLARLGVSSLSIYVLHGGVVWIMDRLLSHVHFDINQYVGIALLFVLSFLIVKVLSQTAIDSLIRDIAMKVSTFLYSKIARKPSL